MAPVDLLYRLRDTYFGTHDKERPIISTYSAALLSIVFTLLYVLPFYLSPTTRPSPNLNRDAPSVIKARIQTVTLACIISSIGVLYLIVSKAHATTLEALHLLGWWPLQPIEVLRCLILTFLLYLGPLFELIFVEKRLRNLQGGRGIVESLSSWQGYRNFVAGPITEEVLFRSVIIPVHILAKVTSSKIVFLTPLYFGIAHIHHFYEFKLTHPDTPLLPSVLRTVFQFGYTTVFGWYAAFIYVRTGSLHTCILIHTFCNFMGLPRFWGRLQGTEDYPATPAALRGKEDADAVQAQGKGGKVGRHWTVAYYILLFFGAFTFYAGFWPMTVSSQALVKFARDQLGHKQ